MKTNLLNASIGLAIGIFIYYTCTYVTSELEALTNNYASLVAQQDQKIKDLKAGTYKDLETLKLNFSSSYESLDRKVEAIDSAINSKSKRWGEIKKIRAVVRVTHGKVNITVLNRYSAAVVDASNEYDVPIPLILAVTRQESAFRQHAVSHAGAQGLMQLMPRTAKECQNDIGKRFSNVFDVRSNVQLGTYYLRKMLTKFEGNTELAVRAYNAGPTYVSKVLAKEYRTYPAETVDYTKRVLGYIEEYKKHY